MANFPSQLTKFFHIQDGLAEAELVTKIVRPKRNFLKELQMTIDRKFEEMRKLLSATVQKIVTVYRETRMRKTIRP